MTKEEAVAKAATKWWEKSTTKEIVAFQLYEPLLCMPFDIFHSAIEKELGRPVFTHEFALLDGLKAEFERRIRKPSLGEAIGKIESIVAAGKIIAAIEKKEK